MTDFRALCAELVDWLEKAPPPKSTLIHCALNASLDRARAALARPEPHGPVLDCDEIEVPAWHRGDDFYVYKEGYTAGWAAGLNAAADCWGRPAIKPVPVAERLPGPEDCDAELCWVWNPENLWWELLSLQLIKLNAKDHFYTHWLPHHALPVPQQEADHD